MLKPIPTVRQERRSLKCISISPVKVFLKYEGKHTESTEWELDEWQLEHLEELGLGDLEDEPGSEFIDYQ
jgi:hypothetical protein